MSMGRALIGFGVLLVLLGGAVMLAEKIPGLGRLPGDLVFQRKSFTVYFPLATSILVSLVLSLLFWLLRARP